MPHPIKQNVRKLKVADAHCQNLYMGASRTSPGTKVDATAAELNHLAGVKPVVSEKFRLDCTGDRNAAVIPVKTLPAGAMLHDVHGHVVEAFDGGTKNINVGVAGTANNYLHASDFDASSKDAQASMIRGTNNGQKTAERLLASTPIIATVNNHTAAGTEGIVDITISWSPA